MPLVQIEGREVRLTHLDKVLWPGTGTTKRELLEYYAAVAEMFLPYSRGRLATFVRTPDGVEGQRFFQKRPPAGTPGWVTVSGRDRRSGGTMDQVQVDDLATLMWAANGGCIEVHTTQSLAAAPEHADRLVLDLDPGEGMTVVDCCRVALWLRARLAEDGLLCWAKTSGSKGLHLLAALRQASPKEASDYARTVAVDLQRQHPELVVSSMNKARRAGRVFIDWSQNNAAKTTAAPYTVRAQAEPTVSTPLSWDEVGAALKPEHLRFTIADVPARIASDGDLLAPLLDPGNARPLPTSRKQEGRKGSGTARRPRSTATDRTEESGADTGGDSAPAALSVVAPMLATPGELPPTAEDMSWAYETKQDGQRALVYLPGDGTLVLRSRAGADITAAYPDLHPLAAALGPGVSAVLDGEIIAPDDQGHGSFQRLQLRMGLADSPGKAARLAREVPAHLVLFDVLFLRGHSLVNRPYADRRRRLENLGLTGPSWSTPAAIIGHGSQALAATWEAGAEGLLCKRIDSPYEPGVRSPAWIKVRHAKTVDAVVGGWVPGKGRLGGLPGAVLLGQQDGDGTLRYIGKVGTGWTDRDRVELAGLLEVAAVAEPPFTKPPRISGAKWVLPRLVCEVRYTGWTAAGLLRHPVWHRLRPDLALEDTE